MGWVGGMKYGLLWHFCSQFTGQCASPISVAQTCMHCTPNSLYGMDYSMWIMMWCSNLFLLWMKSWTPILFLHHGSFGNLSTSELILCIFHSKFLHYVNYVIKSSTAEIQVDSRLPQQISQELVNALPHLEALKGWK